MRCCICIHQLPPPQVYAVEKKKIWKIHVSRVCVCCVYKKKETKKETKKKEVSCVCVDICVCLLLFSNGKKQLSIYMLDRSSFFSFFFFGFHSRCNQYLPSLSLSLCTCNPPSLYCKTVISLFFISPILSIYIYDNNILKNIHSGRVCHNPLHLIYIKVCAKKKISSLPDFKKI